ncbi:TPA: MBL fold metallo-hydrolase [Vibrio cholerae]|uniref:AVAST type 1 anti-phage system MBL fold metallo-hydrolase Avs1a n=1 Tax=Vibrio cholerae TaxID=666 RepID=UPI0018F0E399|nr:AVAST type 1 anti-phage system MBL fold metallo-hydrolase Avs1a [Vibrio cholerae]EGR2435112.1 MBL fold metallo-hydrolase [Vibrio cholerae]MBJ6906333.1 MBL fold metallo-hydrolase [Vibrio cholerae]MCR9705839.1 MBL fold metallo-hydrolase [Vibrio cholerae]HBC3849485.1 MBL fold metallo-hydrolase [Vibrio cholerae]
MRIKMYPAENGDAFLISSDKTNILIDAGYARTFNSYIRQDLEEIASGGACLNLVIVTHIDADHIGGIIRFLLLNIHSETNNIVSVEGIWHNSLRSLTSFNETELSPQDCEVINAINKRGHPKELNATSNYDEISARQGSTLASLIRAGGYVWNDGDGSESVCINHVQHKRFQDGLVKVLTPSRERLDGLVKLWKRDLRRYGFVGSIGSNLAIDDAFELNFEYSREGQARGKKRISAGRKKNLEDVYKPDNSPTNASSIATVIELDGLRVLMLADACAEDVLKELLKMKSQGESMMFDAIKISHHGSNYNTSPELLSTVDAPMYFISSNGSKHNHPDIELLQAIVDREASFTRTLYFNYSTPESREIKDFQTTTGATFIVEEDATNWIEITKE